MCSLRFSPDPTPNRKRPSLIAEIAIVPLGKVERFFELWKELAPALPQEARSGASPASIAER